nr:PASTA domain-containing protein [Chitinophagaceae bacterium]
LVGMTVADALNTLKSMNLSAGPIIARAPVTDTLSSFVVDQSPKVFNEPFPGQKVQNKLKAGQIIDLYISNTAPVVTSDSTTTNL